MGERGENNYRDTVRHSVFCIIVAFQLLPTVPQAKAPPACVHWPETMALMALKNAGITDPTKVDESATTTRLLAAEPRKNGIFREIYEIKYKSRDGRTSYDVITSSDASYEECSVSDVTTYIVSRVLQSFFAGGETQPPATGAAPETVPGTSPADDDGALLPLPLHRPARSGPDHRSPCRQGAGRPARNVRRRV